MVKDYYQILGISKYASAEEVKAAYRKMAMKHHPDRNPEDKDATKKLQEINEAYEVLGDEDKRRLYDIYGSDWEILYKWRNPGKAKGEEGIRGETYHVHIKLSIREAAKEHDRIFRIEGRKVEVTIPAGVEADHYLTFFKKGGLGKNGAANGDLIVHIDTVEEPGWKLIGRDIYAIASIDLYSALLGGEILVNALDGEIKVKINAETQNGRIMRLRGKGFPSYDEKGPRGDFYVTLSVKLPCNLDEKEKRWVKKLAKYRTAADSKV